MKDMSDHGEYHKRIPGKGQQGQRLHSTADDITAHFGAIDEKVNAMRKERINDPDSLGDKLLKFAIPSLAGMIAGKVFETLWKKETSPHHNPGEVRGDPTAAQGLLMSILFAALSAAFGAVVSQLSDSGSRAFVASRQRKRSSKR